MSLKKKLFGSLSMFCLVFVTLIVGVWAVKSTDFTVGGNISFSAKGINATISAGTLSSTGLWVTESDASEKMKEVVINTQKTEEQLQTEFATWQGLDLLFNENGDDVTITFTITNNSTKADEYVGVNVTVNGGTMSNATASISKSSATIAPNSSQQFVISFTITDKKANASLSGFEIAFNLELTDSAPVDVNDVSYLTFSYNDSTMTASVTDCDTSVSSVEIPARIIYNSKTYDVTSIGNYAFSACSGLTSTTIPDSVTSIGNYAFRNCSGLTETLEIPDGVTSIGDSAFYGCSNLAKISIPDSIKNVGDNAFLSCSALEYNIYESGKYLGNETNPYVVLCDTESTTMTSFTFHNDCKIICNQVFYICQELASIILPNKLKSIGTNAFSGCKKLTSITIPDSVISIASNAFQNSGLTEVKIGSGVTSIGTSAFDGCNALSIVYIDSETFMQNVSSAKTFLFNYTQYVYVREDISVTSPYFTEITSDVEGYKKYTETYSDVSSAGGAD